jgi:hypothetical protein
MVSNCSLYPLEPLLPAFDPAYTDGPPPPPRRSIAAATDDGDVDAWPMGPLPASLRGFQTISFETLEDELEREAQREGR